jgi:hypothetical protein
MTYTEKLKPFFSQFFPTEEQYAKTYYHYTRLEALVGMLENKTLWFNDILFQNDQSEYLHGMGLAKKIFNQSIQPYENNDYIVWAAKLFAQQLTDPNEIFRIYTFSLTQNRDTLAHWSRYGKTSQAVCIGFDLKALSYAEKADGSAPTFDPYPVIYNEKDQEKAFKALFDHLFQHLVETPSLKHDTVTLGQVFSYTFSMVAYLSSFFKNTHFEDEAELRLITGMILSKAVEPDFMRFRFQGNAMIPYVVSTFQNANIKPANYIKEILLPKHAAFNENALRLLCFKYGLPREIIKVSEVPYRPEYGG